jgi:hypothetical protein
MQAEFSHKIGDKRARQPHATVSGLPVRERTPNPETGHDFMLSQPADVSK